MRRIPLALAALTSSALVIAGCATGNETGDGSSPSPTASRAEPGVTEPAMLSYPDRPSARWTFSADDAGVTGTDVWLIDPAQIGALGNGLDNSRPLIDAGEAWITAAMGRDLPSTLIGLSPETGETLWTYRPDDALLDDCARPLADGALACLTKGPLGDLSRTAVVLIDPGTGEETGGFDVPHTIDFFSGRIAVAGADVLVLLPADPDHGADDDGWPRLYRVGRYTTDGDEVWSTEVALPAEIPAMGPSEYLEASGTLVAARAIVSQWVLDLDDGALLHERRGSWTSRPGGGGLMRTASLVEVVAADGSIVAELPGYSPVSRLVSDNAAPVLRDPDGVLVELDPATGQPRSPGVPNPWSDDGRPTWPAGASVFGRTLVVTGAHGEGLYGYDLDDPTAPPWSREGTTSWSTRFTDGTHLFTTAEEGSGPDRTYRVVAVRIDDGSLAWTLPLPSSDGTDEAQLARGDGHLVFLQRASITVLDP